MFGNISKPLNLLLKPRTPTPPNVWNVAPNITKRLNLLFKPSNPTPPNVWNVAPNITKRLKVVFKPRRWGCKCLKPSFKCLQTFEKGSQTFTKHLNLFFNFPGIIMGGVPPPRTPLAFRVGRADQMPDTTLGMYWCDVKTVSCVALGCSSAA